MDARVQSSMGNRILGKGAHGASIITSNRDHEAALIRGSRLVSAVDPREKKIQIRAFLITDEGTLLIKPLTHENPAAPDTPIDAEGRQVVTEEEKQRIAQKLAMEALPVDERGKPLPGYTPDQIILPTLPGIAPTAQQPAVAPQLPAQALPATAHPQVPLPANAFPPLATAVPVTPLVKTRKIRLEFEDSDQKVEVLDLIIDDRYQFLTLVRPLDPDWIPRIGKQMVIREDGETYHCQCAVPHMEIPSLGVSFDTFIFRTEMQVELDKLV